MVGPVVDSYYSLQRRCGTFRQIGAAISLLFHATVVARKRYGEIIIILFFLACSRLPVHKIGCSIASAAKERNETSRLNHYRSSLAISSLEKLIVPNCKEFIFSFSLFVFVIYQSAIIDKLTAMFCTFICDFSLDTCVIIYPHGKF